MENVELTREQILSADDIGIEKIYVPEWGGHVFVRTLNADESYQFSKSNVDANGKAVDKNLIVEYCTLTICNVKGESIFTSEDVEKLSKKNTKALLRIYGEARKLNGEDIEELEKNSEQTQSENSDSD